MSPSYYEPGYIPEVQCQRCCYHCTHEELRNGTVFNQITASPEVLAEKLVYYLRYGNCYASSISGDVFKSKEEAIAATVEKLKGIEYAE